MWGHQVGKTNLLLIAKYENHTSITKFVHHPSVVFYMLHDFFLNSVVITITFCSIESSQSSASVHPTCNRCYMPIIPVNTV